MYSKILILTHTITAKQQDFIISYSMLCHTVCGFDSRLAKKFLQIHSAYAIYSIINTNMFIQMASRSLKKRAQAFPKQTSYARTTRANRGALELTPARASSPFAETIKPFQTELLHPIKQDFFEPIRSSASFRSMRRRISPPSYDDPTSIYYRALNTAVKLVT